jgi:hypothetical protein
MEDERWQEIFAAPSAILAPVLSFSRFYVRSDGSRDIFTGTEQLRARLGVQSPRR